MGNGRGVCRGGEREGPARPRVCTGRGPCLRPRFRGVQRPSRVRGGWRLVPIMASKRIEDRRCERTGGARTVTEPSGSIGQSQGRRRGLAGGRPVVCDGILPHDEGEGRTGSGDGTRNRACDRRIRERADRSAGVAQFGGVAPAEAWAMDSRAACVSRRPASGIVGQTGAPRAAEVREAGKSPGFGAG